MWNWAGEKFKLACHSLSPLTVEYISFFLDQLPISNRLDLLLRHDYMVGSPAQILSREVMASGRSVMKIRNNVVPSVATSGTSSLMSNGLDENPFKINFNMRFDKSVPKFVPKYHNLLTCEEYYHAKPVRRLRDIQRNSK